MYNNDISLMSYSDCLPLVYLGIFHRGIIFSAHDATFPPSPHTHTLPIIKLAKNYTVSLTVRFINIVSF